MSVLSWTHDDFKSWRALGFFFICTKAEWRKGGTTFTVGHCVCEIADAWRVLNLTWGSILVSPRQEMRKPKMWWPDVDTALWCASLWNPVNKNWLKAFFSFIFYERSNEYRTVILLRGCYRMIVHTCGVLVQTKNSSLRKFAPFLWIEKASHVVWTHAARLLFAFSQSKRHHPRTLFMQEVQVSVAQPTQLTSWSPCRCYDLNGI